MAWGSTWAKTQVDVRAIKKRHRHAAWMDRMGSSRLGGKDRSKGLGIRLLRRRLAPVREGDFTGTGGACQIAQKRRKPFARLGRLIPVAAREGRVPIPGG